MSPSALSIKDIPVEKADLFCPPLQEIAEILNEKLKAQFEEVKVEVADCPDLSKPPFTLACRGLGGKPTVIEVGGVPYLLPRAKREKLYDLKDVATIVGVNPGFITGAGAGPWPYANTNCEMMVNIQVTGDKAKNQTRIAKVDMETGGCVQEILPDDECRHAVLSNLFASQGQPGKVLKITCRKRTGKDDFVTNVRTSLQSHYKDKPIGLGGVFLVKEGKAKQHVMPDFSKEPLHTEEELNKWLRFFEMKAPLIAVGTLVTADPGLDLRVQHFHSFSHHGEGGHYHNDTTPENVEYLAYFALGEVIYRLDRPKETHQIGRD